MSGLRKVIVTGELVAEVLTSGNKLFRRGPVEVVGGLPEGARFVYAEVERYPGATVEPSATLVLIFEHESWEHSPDGTIPVLNVAFHELAT